MKSKLTPEQITDINRELTHRFGKSPTSLFRCWCDDVIIKLKSSTDRVVFDATLSNNFATPDCEEWREKHDVSMKDIEDELLLANSEITAVNKQIQPLNDIQVKWLREWFANNPDDVGGDLYLTSGSCFIRTATTPQKCYNAIIFLYSRRNYLAKYINNNPDRVDLAKDVYDQMKNIIGDCGEYMGRCEGMVEEFGRTVFPYKSQQTSSMVSNNTPKKSSIMDIMTIEDDKEKQRFLNVLRKLIDGGKGKRVAWVILVCMEQGLFKEKPTHKILTKTFGEIGNRSGFNHYYSLGLRACPKEEIKGIEKGISSFLDSV